MRTFSSRLIAWQKKHGRSDLPWQGADAYGVWVSEIMLQQTQVATVIPYYLRFMQTFPTPQVLAAASEEQVLAHWSGLGYYARGRNLHRAAQLIVADHQGDFPRDFGVIQSLPGIGRSTAAAIMALAFHQRHAILDGNVKRVLSRHGGIAGWPGEKKNEERLWQLAEARLPAPLARKEAVAIYTQAIMDLGATVCTRSKPRCGACPVATDCVAYQEGRTTELPAPRPKKTIPERSAAFLVLQHGNDILLEKRPPSGIWGGLWCPPQFESREDALAWCERQGLAWREEEGSEPFTHVFTHFRLHISPVRLRIARKPVRAGEPGSQWLSLADALEGAIPAPVRRMLGW